MHPFHVATIFETVWREKIILINKLFFTPCATQEWQRPEKAIQDTNFD
jgi:hypothetical protein